MAREDARPTALLLTLCVMRAIMTWVVEILRFSETKRVVLKTRVKAMGDSGLGGKFGGGWKKTCTKVWEGRRFGD
jgi:hypothetical protein